MDFLTPLLWGAAGAVLVLAVRWLGKQRTDDVLRDEYRRLAGFLATGTTIGGFPLFDADRGMKESVKTEGGIETFDYRCERGEERERVERRTCAVAAMPAQCPPLSISRRGAPGPPDSRLPEVAFEAEVFNELVLVRCPDARFAHALIDQRMMEWLLLLPARSGIQVAGQRALAFGPVTKPWERGPVVDLLEGFLSKVPSSLGSLYPS